MLNERIDKSATKSSWSEKQSFASEASPFYTQEKQQGNKSLMLAIEFTNGDMVALPYTSLIKITYTPSEGINLEWGSEVFTIQGHRLKPLFQVLVEHKVKTIFETPDQTPHDPESLMIREIVREE